MNVCVMKKNEEGCLQCVETSLWIEEKVCLNCQWNVDCSGDKMMCAYPKFEGEK